jgi:hypothetical protein
MGFFAFAPGGFLYREPHVRLELTSHNARVAGLVTVEVPEDRSKVEHERASHDGSDGLHVTREKGLTP